LNVRRQLGIDGRALHGAADCTTGICSYSGHGDHCQPIATCFDEVKNGSETAVDCGEPYCNPCLSGRTCDAALDCLSLSCTSGHCD
jgi:hypothetical protein